MGVKVYSAARAVIFEKGKTKEEIWKELTSMFNVEASVHAVSLMPNGWSLEEIEKRSVNDVAGVGDVFKRDSSQIYVPVTGWRPYEFFAYNEIYSPADAKKISKHTTGGGNRMEFSLRDHFEGTIIEVIRRHKGYLSAFDKIMEGRSIANGAAVLLGNILHKFYKESLGRAPFSIHVERDDSLKNDF